VRDAAAATTAAAGDVKIDIPANLRVGYTWGPRIVGLGGHRGNPACITASAPVLLT